MATVIKAAAQDPRLIRRLETVSVSDHLAEAHMVLERSREEARRMLREAQADGVRIRKEASEQGYEEGFRRGYEAGKQTGHEDAYTEAQKRFEADQTQTLAALAAVMEEWAQRKRDLLIDARQDVVRFAARLAEKVTRQVGAVHAESAAANLEAALAMVEKATDVVAHINPADRQTIEKFGAALDGRLRSAANFAIVEDAAVAPGGCRVTTADAEIDATLDTQIARIVELMVSQAAPVERDAAGDADGEVQA